LQTKPENTAQVLNEVAPLKELMVWGEPGCEALLGQLLPKSKSLFFSYYEVSEARREFRNMQNMIENEGVRIIRAKDAVAHLLEKRTFPNLPKTIKELESQLLQKANDYYETYRSRKVRELAEEKINFPLEDIYLHIKKDIRNVLDEDVQTYGENPAIRLNTLLSLSKKLPLSNIFYGRDQSQALADKIVLSQLKWEIRQPEVDIYKEALIELGYGNALIELEAGTVEGGDVAIFGDTCYIGVGARTTLSAVKEICRKIGHLLEQNGIQLAAVVNPKHAEESATFAAPTDEHMHIMHLDMFWIPLSHHLVMAYSDEIDRRIVIRFTRNGDQIISEDLGGFREFMNGKGIEILEVNQKEQEDFATNLLNLGNKTVIMALSKNERVIAELKRRGFKVMSAELNKLVSGYGAIHCLTAPVKRETPPQKVLPFPM
jgi:arginine deiminase